MTDTHTDVRNEAPLNGHNSCKAIAETLARIGDKWTVLVVGALQNGPLRYSELRREVAGISQRMLTLTLKGLEQDGIVERTMYPTIPPRVDYELTELGCDLLIPLKALFEWAVKNRSLMLDARQKFEQKHPQNTAALKSFTAAVEADRQSPAEE
ncbi:winged helix-turn-helix transcriptional regulator [Pseudomonas sp. 5P_3.1_Bac2]|uniref:winged helix-turn-helix transcriptional regulator n=1 Tax=Pseudomonas sp. 5P_3.1_Bac2 TaxID=2971617 RepID=UPI0021C7DA38|nr:helix-turn-helix domain-containing protein [Pseudomonas sp. 5P_3.1_Bac2]MCU1717471.1 helix-turn-helix transcriptional regulator [Pseudomonas sp. 5P_3.1_Bac2]